MHLDFVVLCVGKHGKPTFSLTFTRNPKGKEITDNIPSYQTVSNSPDIVAKVSNQKKLGWYKTLKSVKC
jgi:hypothetical protein